MADAGVVLERSPRDAPDTEPPKGTARAARRLARASAPVLLAVALYTVLAVDLTWPLAEDLNGTIFGSYGDLTGSIGALRELVQDGDNPFLPGTVEGFAAPDGRPIEWPLNISQFSSLSLLYALAAAFGATAAFGLFALLGFVASGTAMFLLARRLTGDLFVSLLMGLAFAFYPFAVVKAGGHTHFVHGWPFVLILWRMLVVYERASVRNGLLAGLAAVVALSWSPYFLLIGGVQYATLAAVGVGLAILRRDSGVRSQVAAQLAGIGVVVCFALALVSLASASSRGTGVGVRTLDEAIAFAARPLEYVVPPSGNELFGAETGPWLQKRLHGSNFAESTLYVGLSMIALSLVALVAAVRRRLPADLFAVVVAAVFMGGMALLWSAPPKVAAFGELIPFPSLLGYEISPAWRVYSRFVMVVMLAVCVLAGIGLERLAGPRRGIARAAVAAVAVVVVMVDLYVPGVGTNDVGVAATKPVFRQLRGLPDGILASYPVEPAGHGDFSAEFEREFHGKPILNGYADGSMAEARALELDRLDDPHTPGRLAALGVRYVLVDRVPIETGVEDPGRPGRGLKLLGDDGERSLWRVVAQPIPMVTAGEGFYPLEQDARGRSYRWIGAAERARIELLGPCYRCSGVLTMDAESFGQPRTLSLARSDGKVVARARVPVGRRVRISLPVRFAHRETFSVATDPGPQSIEATVGGADSRAVSVSLTRGRLELTR
jgi:hypothetical protein